MTYHALDTASRLAPTGKDPRHAAGEFRCQQCEETHVALIVRAE